MIYSRILGTGRRLGSRAVSNEEVGARVGATAEWIEQRTGVRERCYSDDLESPAMLGEAAARAALEAAGVAARDVDCIICSTQTPEHTFPGTACFIQRALGIDGPPALDIRTQCCGFLYGLSMADAYIRAGVHRRVLLVCTEVNSRGLDFSDRGRDLTVLFGDGAGAVLLGPTESPDHGITTVRLHADGRGAEELIVRAPGFAYPRWITHAMIDDGLHYARMSGRAVFRAAVTSVSGAIRETLRDAALAVGDVDHFIPHQGNLRINEAIAAEVGIPRAKCDESIVRHGNCASASIPIALDAAVREGRVRSGQRILMAAFAAGFTWGACVMRW